MGEKTLRRCWRFRKKPALHNVIFFYCIIFKRDKELCAVFGLKTSLYLHIMQCLSEAPSAVFAHTGKNLFHLQPKPVTHCWPTKAVTSNRPQEANTWQNSISKYCNTFSLNVSHNFSLSFFFCALFGNCQSVLRVSSAVMCALICIAISHHCFIPFGLSIVLMPSVISLIYSGWKHIFKAYLVFTLFKAYQCPC